MGVISSKNMGGVLPRMPVSSTQPSSSLAVNPAIPPNQYSRASSLATSSQNGASLQHVRVPANVPFRLP